MVDESSPVVVSQTREFHFFNSQEASEFLSRWFPRPGDEVDVVQIQVVW